MSRHRLCAATKRSCRVCQPQCAASAKPSPRERCHADSPRAAEDRRRARNSPDRSFLLDAIGTGGSVARADSRRPVLVRRAGRSCVGRFGARGDRSPRGVPCLSRRAPDGAAARQAGRGFGGELRRAGARDFGGDRDPQLQACPDKRGRRRRAGGRKGPDRRRSGARLGDARPRRGPATLFRNAGGRPERRDDGLSDRQGVPPAAPAGGPVHLRGRARRLVRGRDLRRDHQSRHRGRHDLRGLRAQPRTIRRRSCARFSRRRASPRRSLPRPTVRSSSPTA